MDPKLQAFSPIKVANEINFNPDFRTDYHLKDGRPHRKIIFDRKFVNLLDKRRFRRENLYETFRTIYQPINRVFLQLENDMSSAEDEKNLPHRS